MASAASARVLKKRAAHNHLSRRRPASDALPAAVIRAPASCRACAAAFADASSAPRGGRDIAFVFGEDALDVLPFKTVDRGGESETLSEESPSRLFSAATTSSASPVWRGSGWRRA